jgi:hypothetical protein
MKCKRSYPRLKGGAKERVVAGGFRWSERKDKRSINYEAKREERRANTK